MWGPGPRRGAGSQTRAGPPGESTSVAGRVPACHKHAAPRVDTATSAFRCRHYWNKSRGSKDGRVTASYNVVLSDENPRLSTHGRLDALVRKPRCLSAPWVRCAWAWRPPVCGRGPAHSGHHEVAQKQPPEDEPGNARLFPPGHSHQAIWVLGVPGVPAHHLTGHSPSHQIRHWLLRAPLSPL